MYPPYWWVDWWVTMPRRLQVLSALSISRRKKPGYLGDGGGLYLQVTEAGSRSWIFRYSTAGKRREMGMGPYPAVSLGAARNLAQEARTVLAGGQDPIAARDSRRARQRLEEASGVTFDQAVEQFLIGNEVGWRNKKHRQQWRNTLRTYVSPTMGALPVGSIDTSHVTRVLDPIWHEKPETASRVRGRIERILDWARVRGYRNAGENPARWRGHLEETYPARGKMRRVKHHPAVPIDAMPAVYKRLREADGMSALALRFIILTASRAGEGLGATWGEIDLDEAVWTLPAARMKAGREHRVPLSREAVTTLRKLAELRTGAHVFPSRTAGRLLSLTALSKALRAAGGGKATVHGFRSTFRDWAAERTNIPRDVAEMALAHAIGDKTEAAYRRGELMKKRAAMMQQWARFLLTLPDANVVPIGRRRA
jgi:integrase